MKGQLTRRKFLKYLGSVFMVPILTKGQNFFSLSRNKKNKEHLKEAKYYRQGNHLAG